MSTVFLYCAAIGGTILVLQFLLLLLGAGTDVDLADGSEGSADVGHDVGHDQSSFLKLISLQTVTTFATFFGLIGLATEGLGWSPAAVSVGATIAGVGALWLVTKAMRSLQRLQSQGNVDLANAVGQRATVYLRIPPHGQGHGRVMLKVQDRTVECRAASQDAAIATGSEVRVVAHDDSDLLIVEPIA
ncbi:MAG: NfeD family protein [Planctomycetes bacterium]|nr:NfeD family protein [Planctomycetota bacterium]